MRGPSGVPVGAIRRLILSNITVLCAPPNSARIASIVAGIPGHPIEDVKINDVVVVHAGGGTASDAQRAIPQEEKKYPEPTMFGTTPAHGFFVRHVRGLEMESVKIEHANPDARPVFVLDDVEGADFGRIKAATDHGVPTFSLNQVRDFSVGRSKPVPDTEIEVVGKKEI